LFRPIFADPLKSPRFGRASSSKSPFSPGFPSFSTRFQENGVTYDRVAGQRHARLSTAIRTDGALEVTIREAKPGWRNGKKWKEMMEMGGMGIHNGKDWESKRSVFIAYVSIKSFVLTAQGYEK
jgi:hypothetical protein